MKLPLGYRYSAVYAGIRKVKQNDLALIVPDSPASAAAVFTQNRVQAAPVRIGRFNLTKSRGLGERGSYQRGQCQLRNANRRSRRTGLLRRRRQTTCMCRPSRFFRPPPA